MNSRFSLSAWHIILAKHKQRLQHLIVVVILALLSACSSPPLLPRNADMPPLVLVPITQAGVVDQRGRFREIFCQVLAARGDTLPDYRPCEEALTTLGVEPAGSGKLANLGRSRQQLIAVVIPGVSWDCFEGWLDLQGSAAAHIRQFGFEQQAVKVDGLSSSANNARQIRNAILQMPLNKEQPRLVLIGYSKGTPDILEAVVNYPEIRPHIAAVVSAAGAVGGSPLANHATQSQAELLQHWPGAQCTPGDGGAVESLRSATRKRWLAQNPLPQEIPYYSLVALPDPDRISTVLTPSYNTLSQVDARNDGQVLFYDQVIPGSKLLAYLNADHWAVVIPIARSHDFLGATLVEHNDFPREALLEAILRLIEEDLAAMH